jgi:hypothetical protein
LYTGYTARIQGTITASGFSSGTNDDYLQDATGAVNVYRSTETPTPFTSTTPGQLAEVRGRVNFLGGRFRLDMTESLEKASSPFGLVVLSTNPPPSPTTATIAAIAAEPESFEGQLVAIANAQIVSGTIPSTPQPLDAFVTIADGTGTLQLKIDHDTDVEGFTPAARFTAIGIIQQDDYLRPFDTSYNITPRNRVDLGADAPAPPPLLTIGEARIDEVNNADGTPGADFIPDRLNQVVRVQGTVTSIDFRGGNGIEYYIQDATGAVDLFATSIDFGPFAIDDTVEATGAVTQFNGLTELTVTVVSFVASGSAPAAIVITLSQLADGHGEAFEGKLVRIDNLVITSGLFPAAGSSGNVTIADGTGTATLRVDSDTNIDGTATPPGTFSATGILGQFSSAPFDSGYQLLPRFLDDIVASGGGGPALIALPATLAFPATTLGDASVAPVTLTNNGSSTLTLTTPFTISGADASQFQVDAPAATMLDPGASTTVSVTFLPTAAGAKNARLNIASSAGAATVALTGTGQTSGGGGGGVVISEIRFRGPLGGNDEFVEIYNNSDTAADISGWKLMGSSNTAPTGTRATVRANTILPARTHYLFVNVAASGYSGAVPGNTSYPTGFGDNGGVALTMPDNTIVDQVGITTTGTAYREGAPIPTQLTTHIDRGYERRPGHAPATLQDTDDNASDFALVTPTNAQSLGLTASPAALDFGTVNTGESASLNATVRNNFFNTTVTLTSFTIGGANASDFSAGAPGTASLAGDATTTAPVTFAPSAAGARSAVLEVASGNGGSAFVALTGLGVFVDRTAPALTLPADMTTEATGPTTIVTFTMSASDETDPAPVVACTPAPGFAFPVATTTVDCTATDTTGNVAHGSFTVTVTDHTPPALTLSGNISATATSPSGAVVTYSVSAVDLVDGSRPVTCSPASGSTFPIGMTTVQCSASDTHTNTANGSFTVTVAAPDQPGEMIAIGSIAIGSTTQVFVFDVKEHASGADAGDFQYVVMSKTSGGIRLDTFDATAIASVVFFNVPGVSPGSTPASGVDTVTISGSGRWNGRRGYTFAATAVDAGEPGRGQDTFAITIRSAEGQVVASVDAPITQGNIQSLRLR